MNAPDFKDIADRLRSGERLEEREFEKRLSSVVDSLVREYDIRYVPERPVPKDTAMVDRCYLAARELYENVGTYCIDTERAIWYRRVHER